jgi:hypothetical protein
MANVTFDGPNKLIILGLGVTTVDVKADLYAGWKTWVLEDDHSKYLPALRSVGGDPLSEVKTLGSTFFLTNGWRIRPQEATHWLRVNGNLFTDPSGDSPFVATLGNYNVTIESTVSNLSDVATANLGDVATAVGAQTLPERAPGPPPIVPTIAEALQVIYSALRNKVVSEPDGVTHHKADGTPLYKQPVTTVPATSVTRDGPEAV